MTKIKILIILVLTVLLNACSGFFDKDNTPKPAALVKFTPEIKVQPLWKASTNGGVGNEYLRLRPALTERAIFTASKGGTVTKTDRINGKTLWKINTGTSISAGPGASNQSVVVGSPNGDVIVINSANGQIAWRTKLYTELLAAPVVKNNIILVKTVDGKLIALSESDGHLLWQYKQTEPALILRGASSPQVYDHYVVSGFANGNLAKLMLNGGNLLWQKPISTSEGSFAIQRMIDIDADPLVFNNRIYAATYQGHIVALDLATGDEIWTHDISSYTGIAVDEKHVYITDAKSHIWAFDIQTGAVAWHQAELQARNITGPKVMMGHYVVLGDAEGYLHWFSRLDGHIVARIKVNSSAIIANPVVHDNTVYVVTTDGHLAAYRLG